MESVDSVIVSSKGYLVESLISRHLVLSLEVEESETIFLNTSATRPEVGIRLGQNAIVDHKFLPVLKIRYHSTEATPATFEYRNPSCGLVNVAAQRLFS